MSKHVIVIASGETERRSLSHLLAHLRSEDIFVVEVRRPGGNKALNVDMAERLVKAAWYAPTENVTPDKFVILVDADGKDPNQVLRPFRRNSADALGQGSARLFSSLAPSGISRPGILRMPLA